MRQYSFPFLGLLNLAILLCTVGHAIAEPGSTDRCVGCHSNNDVMPALFEQYQRSKHFESTVGCLDCHAAEEGDVDAFEHHGGLISIIVSPRDCERCHEAVVEQFNRSAHVGARVLVTEGLGDYFLKNLVGSRNLSDHLKYVPGTNGCWRCHGSKIEIGSNGRPTSKTWPNSGIGRENPDGSKGNCTSCHSGHEFSVAEARRPESCAVCHNAGGGDPQVEAYRTSTHGLIYYSKIDQMNLESDSWIVGRDYFAAPTCSTCHMSATPDMPATHDINERLHWNEWLQTTNTIAVKEKCGLPDEVQALPYQQPIAGPKHKDDMKNVCRSCHSGTYVDNSVSQYENEVRFFMERWIEPGRTLFQLATRVLKAAEGDDYRFLTHPIDFVWFGMCNDHAKSAHTGAAMMSAGQVEIGIGGLAANWQSSFVPAIRSLIDDHRNSTDSVKEAVDALEQSFDEIQRSRIDAGAWPEEKTGIH